MFRQVFIYFAETLRWVILACKKYFRICVDFIDDSSILISGYIDETKLHWINGQEEIYNPSQRLYKLCSGDFAVDSPSTVWLICHNVDYNIYMSQRILRSPGPMTNLHIFAALFFAAILFCGCSSTKFTEYHGSDVFQGKGSGSVREVDGIDFWESGDTDRKYKILGMIERGRAHSPVPGRIGKVFSGPGEHDSAIAKAAHDKGGDAVIVVKPDFEPSDDAGGGGQRHRRARKFLVVKYVDSPQP